MAIKYPVDCDSPRKKTEWLYRAQELLRLLHNIFGKWYREGLTQVQYDKLPQKIKDKYSYKVQLAESKWKQFLNEDFEPRSQKISNQICVQREQLKQSNTWSIEVGNV